MAAISFEALAESDSISDFVLFEAPPLSNETKKIGNWINHTTDALEMEILCL